jgi:hypothetical protein
MACWKCRFLQNSASSKFFLTWQVAAARQQMQHESLAQKHSS